MNETQIRGVIHHPAGGRKTDYLYRVSMKGIVVNDTGEILLVKESGRDWWDLPGGGMDHGEDIKEAIAREMKEEVNLTGDFTYQVIHVGDPKLLEHSMILQIRLIFLITPKLMAFSAGDDADEVAFLPLEKLKEIHEPSYRYLTTLPGRSSK